MADDRRSQVAQQKCRAANFLAPRNADRGPLGCRLLQRRPRNAIHKHIATARHRGQAAGAGARAVAWGFNWIAAAFALQEVPPWSLRFVDDRQLARPRLIAATSISAAASLTVPPGAFKHIALAGFFNVAVFNICAAFAQLSGATSRAVIITYSMPIWSAVGAWLVLGDKLDKVRLIALGLCVGGLAILLWPLFADGIPRSAFFALGSRLRLDHRDRLSEMGGHRRRSAGECGLAACRRHRADHGRHGDRRWLRRTSGRCRQKRWLSIAFIGLIGFGPRAFSVVGDRRQIADRDRRARLAAGAGGRHHRLGRDPRRTADAQRHRRLYDDLRRRGLRAVAARRQAHRNAGVTTAASRRARVAVRRRLVSVRRRCWDRPGSRGAGERRWLGEGQPLLRIRHWLQSAALFARDRSGDRNARRSRASFPRVVPGRSGAFFQSSMALPADVPRGSRMPPIEWTTRHCRILDAALSSGERIFLQQRFGGAFCARVAGSRVVQQRQRFVFNLNIGLVGVGVVNAGGAASRRQQGRRGNNQRTHATFEPRIAYAPPYVRSAM